MSDSSWPNVKRILELVVNADHNQRHAILTAECAGDGKLLREINSFLQYEDDCKDSFFFDAEQATLGPYQLKEEIGRGGMGVVFRGQRSDHLFEKQVAVKILETVFQPADLVRRFDKERRILAQLDHPAIARLLDAGLTPAGKPYYVLELVEGKNLSAYLKSNQLTDREKLQLFLRIADAVSYAHQQLIIHLDIKPGNILVAKDGSPKLLDFGLAKVLDPDTRNGGDATRSFMRIMTPAYASPEQIAGDPLTVASDIYSLGVVLYEMLSGRKPIDFDGLNSASMLNAVLNTNIPPPLANRRDLNEVILRALAKPTSERYRSVEQFADDIRRYLNNQPVTARKATFWHQLQLLFVRHRAVMITAAAALICVLLAAAVALNQARQARRHLEQAHQVTNSLLFELHDAVKTLPGGTAARELILQRATQYLNALSKDAGGDNSLKRDLAESYMRIGDVEGLLFESNLGKTQQARQDYQHALKLFEEIASSQPLSPGAKVDLAEAHIRLGTTLSSRGDHKGALAELDKAHDIAASTLFKIPPVKIVLGKVSFGRAENYEAMGMKLQALPYRRDSIRIMDDLYKSNSDNPKLKRFVALAHKRYAASLMATGGNLDEAINQIQLAREVDLKCADASTNSAVQSDLALDAMYMGAALERKGNLDRSESEYRQALHLYANLANADSRDVRSQEFVVNALAHMASVTRKLNRLDEAQGYLKEAMDRIRRMPDAALKAAELHLSLGRVLSAKGQKQAGVNEWKTAQAIYSRPELAPRLLPADRAFAQETESLLQSSR